MMMRDRDRDQNWMQAHLPSFVALPPSLLPEDGVQPDMPLGSAPYQWPLSNTRPLHHQNSVGTCCVQRVAQ